MKEKVKKFIKMAIIVVVVLLVSSCRMKSTKDVKIADRIGYEVECQLNKNDQKLMEMWLQDYMEQYKQKGLESNLCVKSYAVSKMEVMEEGIIKINLEVTPKEESQVLAQMLDGTYDMEKQAINCQWILGYEKKIKDANAKGKKVLYTVTEAFAPGSYQNDQYNLSEEKQIEEYESEYMVQTKEAKIASKNTYRIFGNTCSISNDNGKTWTKVPIAIEKLCKSADGNSYYNQLQNGSYILDEEKAIFVFGGTPETRLSIVKSMDGGKTWDTVAVEVGKPSIKYARVKFVSFPTKKVGYIVVTTEKNMNQEGKAIFKTTDGGNTFSQVKIKTNIQEHCLNKAVFLTEQLGFITMVGGEKPEIYRTEDGGKIWEIILIPEVSINGVQPFCQPEIPYLKEEKLYLLVGQGADGDYEGGRCKAKFISKDEGKSFQYTNEIVE
jgi:photosystem II stability/assembly factor-like uncharacterized protein